MKSSLRRFTAVAVCAAALGMAGCSSQTGLSGNGRLSDLLDVSSWTLNSRLPENNDDGGATDIVMSTEEQTPEPFPPLVTDQARSKQSPQTIAIDTALASLPPVIDRHFDDPAHSGAPTAEGPDSHPDIWSRIRANMTLPSGPTEHLKSTVARIGTHESPVAWIGTHERYFKQVTKRAEPYLYHIVEAVEKRAMPSEIALLPIIESGYKPFAYSPSHAAGLWQIIPGTGRHLGLRTSWWYDGRRDVLDGTEAALDYLQLVNNNLGGDWLLSIAAYNGGEGAVRRARAKAKANGRGTDFWSIRPYLPRETQAYVPRLLAVAAAVRAPSRFKLSLADIPNQPYFTVVPLQGQLDLGVAAQTAGIKIKQMQRLNPGFKRWATDPDGPHRLLLPIEKVEAFKVALAKLPAEQRITWRRHQVRQGESLSIIAQRYGTRTDVLRKVNRLQDNTIRTGTDVLVPQSVQDVKNYALALPPDTRKTSPWPSRRSQQTASSAAEFTKTYKTRKGDSLWAIAKRTGTSTGALARANGLTHKSTLYVGQTLRVPGPPASTKKIARSGKVRHYKVRNGDSLWDIAKREGVGIADLRAWNHIRSDVLKVGQILKLYPPGES